MDTTTLLVFAVTLIVQVGGYVLWKSYRAAADRVQHQQDRLNTRPRGGIGISYIGGHNQVGEN